MNPEYQNIVPPAPVKQQNSRLSPKVVIVAIGAILAIVAAASLLILMNSNKPVSQMQRLSARFENLQTLVDLGTKHVQNQDLKKVQSEASILIASNSIAVIDAMQATGLDTIPKEIKALEVDTTTIEALKDAELNGRFDDAYKKALSQKLESTMALMREVGAKSTSKNLKTAITTGYTHFGSLLDQLAKL